MPGTSSEDAGKTLDHIDDLFCRRFSRVSKGWAYTSSGVRKKLEQNGRISKVPYESLSELRKQGITHLAVKSLHLVSGVEYTELKKLLQEFTGTPNGFVQTILSKPLLDAPGDFERTVRWLLDELPKCDALLLVAHGSKRHEAQSAYEAAATLCRKLDRRVILSTLMSNHGLEDVIRECKTSGLTQLVIAPLMIVAGLSTRNELAGNDPASWASAFEREGIRCVPVIKGLGDNDDIVRIWLDDVERMMLELSRETFSGIVENEPQIDE